MRLFRALAVTTVLLSTACSEPPRLCGGGANCLDSGMNTGADGDIDSNANANNDGASTTDTAGQDGAIDVPGDAPIVGFGCSSDLRSVLDSNGVAIGRCPDDQGCSMGRCVPACAAASQSRGTIACDFYAATPPAYPPALPPCHAMFVTNTWSRPARLTVTRGTTSYDATRFGRIVENGRPATSWAPIPAEGIPVDGVAVLFLSSDPNSVMPETDVPLRCPVVPAINSSTVIAGTGETAAWRVQSDVPVGAYDMLPYGGAPSFFPSAQLVLPTSVYGDTYVVMNAPVGTASSPGPNWVQIIATENGTTVRVRPTQDFTGRGALPSITRGNTGELVLAAGQIAQYEVRGSADLSGTLIVASRPVAVFAGNRFLRLQTTPTAGGDSTHQQLVPVSALSNEYVGAPYETRRRDLMPESIPYRIVGAADGTRLTFDPPIAGAPTDLARGQVVDFNATEAFIVKSQDPMHPFAFAQLMTSSTVTSGSREGALEPYMGRLLGDEEFVLAFPPAQFLQRYVFFSDPSYPTTSLTVVRKRRANGTFAPVNIDCIGDITGFRAVGTGSPHAYEFATVDLLRAGRSSTGCTNGRHTALSDGAFGITVWGLDSYASYAYPAGGNAAVLQTIPIPL